MTQLSREVEQRIQEWIAIGGQEMAEEVSRLRNGHPEELLHAFDGEIAFGTGGMRARMGIGPTQINELTIRLATQGLSDFLNSHFPENRVFIGYDTRNGSRKFARTAASVFAGNGISVLLLPHERPTPYISFGCRKFACTAAVMITASHNTKEYNGYKVYGPDGAQVSFPHDKAIMESIGQVKGFAAVKSVGFDHPLISMVDIAQLDQAYIDQMLALRRLPDQPGKDQLSIVYTSLHGVGATLLPSLLHSWGFSKLYPVAKQNMPDGDFPSLISPNPEEDQALSWGVAQMNENKADLLLATDPDADRVRVVVWDGEPRFLSGNDIAALAVWFLCATMTKPLPGLSVIKSLVTTPLVDAIVLKAGIDLCFVLTGFKYIGAKIQQWEEARKEGRGEHQFLFGAEESCGYLLGTNVRDKDAISSSGLIAEMVLYCKNQGKTLIQQLEELYQEHGVFQDQHASLTHTDSHFFAHQMESLRRNPLSKIGTFPVISIADYQTGLHNFLHSQSGEPSVKTLDLPQSNVLVYFLENGSQVIVRPSGTEPKLKIYVSSRLTVQGGDVQQTILECRKMGNAILTLMKKLLSNEV